MCEIPMSELNAIFEHANACNYSILLNSEELTTTKEALFSASCSIDYLDTPVQLTYNMIRDTITPAGQVTLSEIVRDMEIKDEYRPISSKHHNTIFPFRINPVDLMRKYIEQQYGIYSYEHVCIKIQKWIQSLGGKDVFNIEYTDMLEFSSLVKSLTSDNKFFTINELNKLISKSQYFNRRPLGLVSSLTNCYLTTCESYRILDRSVRSEAGSSELGYFRQKKIDPQFVSKKFFGYQSVISGLDFILAGGINVKSTDGTSIAITGEYGTGKTTLSLQLAIDRCLQGAISFYIVIDETSKAIQDKLDQFEFLKNTNVEYFNLSNAHNSKLNKRNLDDVFVDLSSRSSGALIIASVAELTSNVFLEFVAKHSNDVDLLNTQKCIKSRQMNNLNLLEYLISLITFFAQKLSNRKDRLCIAFDSLDSLYERIRLHPDTQSPFTLVDRLESSGYFSILVANSTGILAEKISYYCNIVIELCREHDSVNSLHLRKTRGQRSHVGKHEYIITDRSGIMIIPNLTSMNYTLRLCPVPDHPKRSILLGDFYIPAGSASLLTGDRNENLSSFAMKIEDTNNYIRTLVFSCRIPAHRYNSKLTNVYGTEYSRLVKSEEIVVDHIYPGRDLTSSILMNKVWKAYRNSLISNRRFGRIIFDGFRVLRVTQREIFDDGCFLSTLIEFCRVHSITLIVGYGDLSNERLDFSHTVRSIDSLFDFCIKVTDGHSEIEIAPEDYNRETGSYETV